MRRNPTFDYEAAVVTTAANAYQYADIDNIDPDTIIWEVLQVRYEKARKKSPAAFEIEPGNFICKMINSCGLQEYQRWREAVIQKRKLVDQQR